MFLTTLHGKIKSKSELNVEGGYFAAETAVKHYKDCCKQNHDCKTNVHSVAIVVFSRDIHHVHVYPTFT